MLLPVLFLLSAVSPPLPHTNEVIDGHQHRIIWTVDDHPCQHTKEVLKILKTYHLRAIFFINAWGVRYYYQNPRYAPNRWHYERLMAIYRAGHLLGNHSLDHPFMCRKKNRAVRRRWIHWQLSTNHKVVKRATGVDMKFFRPPGGFWCPELIHEVRHMHLRTVMWDVDDYRTSALRMWRQVRWRARHRRQTIILFHCQPKKLLKFLHFLRRHP